MRKLLGREKIDPQPSMPYIHQHSGCAERANLELEDKIRTLLISAKMPNYFWNCALQYVVHVHNRTLNSAIDFKTPYFLDAPLV